MQILAKKHWRERGEDIHIMILSQRIGFFSLAFGLLPNAWAGNWSGNVALELRAFTEEGASQQHSNYFSLAAQPEYYAKWDDGKQSFTFVPFVRVDQHDEERSHADVRELTWLLAAQDYEWRIGVRKIFWGVTESQHLIDIVNQTDAVENPDGEEKLGQPMINLALIRAWGTLDLFMLPGFRERTFAGVEGRLRFALPVDTNQATYTSSQQQRHIDYAVRWRKTLDAWDMGLSYFTGTSRDPRFTQGSATNGQVVLVPHYDLIKQTGFDVQATLGAWLWKLEAIHRSGQGQSYNAATGGLEYTFVNVAESGVDVGMIGEYLYDERGTTAATPFQNDAMIGSRFAFNDEQSTELLLGGIFDRDTNTRLYSLEANRRIGAHWKVSVEARAYVAVAVTDPLYALRNDDYFQIEAARFF